MDCQAFSYPIKLSSQIMIPKHGMAQTSAVLIWLVLFLDIVWWCHDMETLSVLLALYKGNPPITGGFPSQRASDRDLWCSLLCWISWINSRVASNLGWHDPHVTSPVPYPTMLHSEQKWHISVLNGALWVWNKCILGFVNLVNSKHSKTICILNGVYSILYGAYYILNINA